MANFKQERVLEIFFRALRGEDISVQRLANEYGVSTKSISRSINDLKAFLAEHRELVGAAELEYSHKDKCYRLETDGFLSSKELFATVEVLIGARAFSKKELLEITDKLRRFTTVSDREKLNELIHKELYHYPQVHHDCQSVQDTLWQVMNCILDRREIAIEYYRMDRTWVTHRLIPASVMFTDYYFYLIAFSTDADTDKALYFRIDRIKNIVKGAKNRPRSDIPEFDEGLLRRRSLFMWPGKLRTVRFEFSGPSVQAVLDKLPTAEIISRDGTKCLIEAETYGDGIKLWLLSQGSWARVVSPVELADEMRAEIEKMHKLYE